jgi:glycosyltransferase involved in cell wall biosynthesis
MSLDIAFVSTYLRHVRGGAEINDLNLGKALRELGHDVVHVTFEDESAEMQSIDVPYETVEAPLLLDLSYRVPWPTGKLVRHLNTSIYLRRLRQARPSSLTEADLVLTTGRPHLLKLQSMLNGVQFYSVRGPLNPIYTRSLRGAQGLVFWGGCETDFSDEQVLSRPSVRIDPAIDHDVFSPSKRDPELRRRLVEGDDDATVLTYVGRLDKIKQVDVIVEAVARLHERGHDSVRLVVVGDGAERDSLESLATERTRPGVVRFEGRVPQVRIPEYLTASDVFVMASRQENHPIALKEALACGTYAVAPDVGRVQEIIDEPTLGHVYPAGTPDQLTETLETVLADRRFADDDRSERARTFETWLGNARSIGVLFREVQ